MAVAECAGGVSNWRLALEDLKNFVAPAFRRSEQCASAGVFIDGLLSGVDRKTGWMLAEEAGLARPYRIESLLDRLRWSADALCDRVRRYALDALGDANGVLVIDETGFLRRAPILSASPGSIPALRAGSRTARLASSPAMTAAGATNSQATTT